MGYNELEVELRKIEALIARWRSLGYLPAIEQGIALRRLQKVYAELIEMPCGEPQEIEIEPVAVPVPAEAAVVETEGVSYDGMAPDDESFEPYAPFEAPEEVAVVIEEEVEEEPDEPVGGMSEETHVRQDDEAHDLCPPQLEFPEADEPVGGMSEETHVRQDDEAHDLCPPQLEFPEAEEPVGGMSEETHVRQDDEAHDLCPPQLAFPEADEPAPAKPVEKPQAQKPKPESPRILGIEVSPYARHEIIDTLFHGNVALFEAETAKIDAMDSLEEALVYVGETYRWIPENAATIKFIDLLESRFEK